MKTNKITEGFKIGKRLARTEVRKLMQAIELLLDVAGYVDYKDEVQELFDDLISDEKEISRGDLNKIRQAMIDRQQAQESPVSSGGGQQKANWSAKVGQAIIGNLARGKGGRFVSASNITNMMGQLDRANISAETFNGLQNLLEGGDVDPETMQFLQSAGLVTEDGNVSAKANDIVTAIQSGDPDNLKGILKPEKPKTPKGRGKKPEKPPKPTKEEKEAQNVASLKDEIVANERMTAEQYDAFANFAEGNDVDKLLLEELEDLGLVEIDPDGFYKMTSDGNRVMSALQKGELRNALDRMSDAKEKAVKEQKEEAENKENVSNKLVEDLVLLQQQINDILAFYESLDVESPEFLTELNIAEDTDGELESTETGNQLIDAIEKGDVETAKEILPDVPDMTAEEKEALRVDMVKNEIVNDNPEIPSQLIDDLVNDDLGENSTEALVALGILEQTEDGTVAKTKFTDDLISAIKNGKVSNTLDIIRKAKDSADIIESDISSELNQEQFNALQSANQGNFNVDPEVRQFLIENGYIKMNFEAPVLTDKGKRLLEQQNDNGKAFTLKVLNGNKNDYLMTWTTNAYTDREEETFTLKSIKEYVKQCDERENKGTYQFWHIEGSDFADIVAQTVSGKFLVEIGKFKKTDVGQAFKMFFSKYPNGHPDIAPNGWGCSHGFVYQKQDREDGVYEWFDKRETTILPLEEAANVFTLMEIL